MSPQLAPEQQRAVDYLRAKGTRAPIDQLRERVGDAFANIERAFDEVPPASRGTKPAADRWSPHQILDHLVLSHAPAVSQFASLIAGVTPDGVAVPADLSSSDEERRPWETLRAELGSTHAELLRLMNEASEATSLEPTAVVEMVIKVDGKPVHWYERFDWKAFIQAVRVHTMEHEGQLARAVASVRPSFLDPA